MTKALGIAVVACLVPCILCAVEASNRYRSPRNPERKIRQSTELIVLHTTEAPAKSSLNKLSERGEAHFCVTEEGQIYRIVDRDREAFHAGRSMWNGKEDVDKFSIGIECVGYHDKPMPPAQIAAIRDLVAELKAMYRLGDSQVVCHSHVAYGAPNKWQKRNHRGRKRCGMLFAMPSVRAQLNLKTKPKLDRDVQARRLTVGDEYLSKVLYGNVDTMRQYYAVIPSKPAPKEEPRRGIFSWFGSNPKPAAKKTPAKPKTVAGTFKAPPQSVADLKAQGFKQVGVVTKDVTASKLVGARWNRADTYYTIRNKVIPGNTVNPSKIEIGMAIWLKK